jgi:hypothetical protein
MLLSLIPHHPGVGNVYGIFWRGHWGATGPGWGGGGGVGDLWPPSRVCARVEVVEVEVGAVGVRQFPIVDVVEADDYRQLSTFQS